MEHVKSCRTCGTVFTTTNVRKLYCQPRCKSATKNAARTRGRSLSEIVFVGVDGEGVDRPDGTHEYIMLSVGERTLWKDGVKLTVGEILPFLWECYQETPDACFVGFFLGYDFTQWVKSLPERQAYLLLSNAGIRERTSQRRSHANRFPDPVVVDETWEIDIMANRRFKLRPHTHRRSRYFDACRNRTCLKPMVVSDGSEEISFGVSDKERTVAFTGWGQITGRRATGPWMMICDTGSFWQTSFVNVIDPKGWGDHPVCSDDEYATVVQGKADRGTVAAYGSTDYYPEMRQYNVLENEILARVTTRLNEGFMNDHIPIRIPRKDWYGPGRAAQLWMDMLHDRIADRGAMEYNRRQDPTKPTRRKADRRNETGILSDDIYQTMPAWFVDAARSSYYGGWFEQFIHGHCGDVWEYDINSAYPYIIATLPCLHTTGTHTGRYRRGTGRDFDPDKQDPKTYTLVHATISGSDPYIGAMPFRTHTGHILRPHRLKGWYWWHEIQASRHAGLVDTVDVEEWVTYYPCHCPPPFNPMDIGITRMYDLRLGIGKNSPAGKAFKLVYNSAYGKTAQSIGSPKFANPVYASLITAGCRTLILEAISTHPLRAAGVTMVATDGVYFTVRHPSLALSKTVLGAWDETFKANLTQLMPGVYWDDTTRKLIQDNETPKMKSRGVNAKDLARQIERLDYLFAEAHFALTNGQSYEWPEIEFSQKFLMTTAKSALHRGKWNEAGLVTHGSTRRISSNPQTKRHPEPYRDGNSIGGYVRTRPYREWNTLDTTPYERSFGYAPEDPQIDRDGRDPLAYFRDLLNM